MIGRGSVLPTQDDTDKVHRPPSWGGRGGGGGSTTISVLAVASVCACMCVGGATPH